MEHLTVNEVAARFAVTSLTVRRWLKSGSLSGIRCEDRAGCRISQQDVQAFLDARRRGGVHERPERRDREV